MRHRMLRLIFAMGCVVAPGPTFAADRAVPYWASITAGDALLRTGPGRNYPASWRYRRAQLPVQVIQVHDSWRKVRDRDGTVGWMAAVLLSAERTAIVIGETQPMRGAPDSTSRLLWRAEPGVVGRIRHCGAGWCEFNVGGKTGYIETSGLWGMSPNESVD